jgi:hypothetical protein
LRANSFFLRHALIPQYMRVFPDLLHECEFIHRSQSLAFCRAVAIFKIVRNGDPALSDERSEPVVDLAYIGRALQRLTTEVASLRDDMHVLTAIVQRLDNPQGRMLEELRAMHRQQSRFGERLRQLEEQR